MTREVALKTDSKVLGERVRELSKMLDTMFYDDNDGWDSTYNEYCMLNSILDERYREENIEAFEKFFFKFPFIFTEFENLNFFTNIEMAKETRQSL